ncbi:MAG: topoisomerase DNA-binding C4 zinc finger domain-containing protein, partial [Anaerolineae bacterium]|nr:topoisomerase DNA-binding C4 zinc finger domain-containing protein [Anaerolineae bacterium]
KVAPTPIPAPVGNPLCPKCGSTMVLRTAKNGANAGNRFWGCSNYPKCHSMMPYIG